MKPVTPIVASASAELPRLKNDVLGDDAYLLTPHDKFEDEASRLNHRSGNSVDNQNVDRITRTSRFQYLRPLFRDDFDVNLDHARPEVGDYIHPFNQFDLAVESLIKNREKYPYTVGQDPWYDLARNVGTPEPHYRGRQLDISYRESFERMRRPHVSVPPLPTQDPDEVQYERTSANQLVDVCNRFNEKGEQAGPFGISQRHVPPVVPVSWDKVSTDLKSAIETKGLHSQRALLCALRGLRFVDDVPSRTGPYIVALAALREKLEKSKGKTEFEGLANLDLRLKHDERSIMDAVQFLQQGDRNLAWFAAYRYACAEEPSVSTFRIVQLRAALVGALDTIDNTLLRRTGATILTSSLNESQDARDVFYAELFGKRFPDNAEEYSRKRLQSLLNLSQSIPPLLALEFLGQSTTLLNDLAIADRRQMTNNIVMRLSHQLDVLRSSQYNVNMVLPNEGPFAQLISGSD